MIRPIDIDIPATEEDWIGIAIPKRKLSEDEVGIDFPLITSDARELPELIIDGFKWVTIPGKGQINIGGAGGGFAGRQVPALKTATGAEREKLLAINDYMIQTDRHQRQYGYGTSGNKLPIDNPERKASYNKMAAAGKKAEAKGMSLEERNTIARSKGKDCTIIRKDGTEHSIWESPEKATKSKPKKPARKPEPKKSPPKPARKPEPKKPEAKIDGDKASDVEITSKGTTKGKLAANVTDNPGTSYNNYVVRNKVPLNVDSRLDQKKVLSDVRNELKNVPEEHLGAVGGINVVKGSLLKKLDGDSNVTGFADYRDGKINIFSDNVGKSSQTSVLMHEIGHFQQKGKFRDNPSGFNSAMLRDKKNVTWYGTQKNKGEAYPEAYAKFFATGKVTDAGGKNAMTNTTAWMSKNYSKRKFDLSVLTITFLKRIDISKLERIVSRKGSVTITRYVDKDGVTVAESFADDKAELNSDIEVIVEEPGIIMDIYNKRLASSLHEIEIYNKRPAIPRGMRREVIHNSNGICCICGKKSKYIFLHHIDGNRYNHKHDNLIALCTAHHDEVHMRNGNTKGISQVLLKIYKRNWEVKVKKNREMKTLVHSNEVRMKDRKQFDNAVLILTDIVLERPAIVIDDGIVEHEVVIEPADIVVME